MLKKIIGIYGAPRSGTTWIGEIFNSSEELIYKFQPQFAYRFRGRIEENTSRGDIIDCFNELFLCEDDFIDQRVQRDEGKLPIFKKDISKIEILAYKEVRFLYTVRNLLNTCPEFMLIGIIRNPIDVLESWMNAPKEYQADWEIEKEWRSAPSKNQGLRENFYGYDKWKETVAIFDDLSTSYRERVYLVKYEELVSDTVNQVKQMFQFCDLKFGSQTENFIGESTQKTVEDAYAVYRNKNRDRYCRVGLPEAIKDEILSDVRTDVITKRYFN